MIVLDKNDNKLPPLEKNNINITEFFKERHVLITGATGFMGKVLVEKLLRSCFGVGNIYLLLRLKKGVLPKDRLTELLKSPVFDRLKDENPSGFSKIVPIRGDVTALGLGLSVADRELLQHQVSVVFHVASVVRFGEPLQKAILMNVRGTQELLELARGMKSVKAVVYVSTAYSKTDTDDKHICIDERVHVTPDWRTLVLAAERMEAHMLDVLTPKIIGGHANTYTFTKLLAESVVNDYREQVPVIILRPSIVCYSIREPMPGWIDSLNGPAGLYVGLITGVVHVVLCDKNVASDFVPVDAAINSLIAAAWYRGLSDQANCIAMNCASGENKHITYEFACKIVEKFTYKVPPQRILWCPSIVFTTNYTLYYLLMYFTHVLPALFIDRILQLKGIKFRLLAVYRKIHSSGMIMRKFAKTHYDIKTDLFRSLFELMHDKDRDVFVFDATKEDEVEIIKSGTLGLKKYILNENSNEELDRSARRNINMYYWLDRSLKAFFVMLFVWVVFKKITIWISNNFINI